ncbi:unnamed protein product [Alopecurus aequalis]
MSISLSPAEREALRTPRSPSAAVPPPLVGALIESLSFRSCGFGRAASSAYEKEDLRLQAVFPQRLRDALHAALRARDPSAGAFALGEAPGVGAAANPWFALAPDDAPENPLIAFVNPRSGGRLGPIVKTRLKELIGEDQGERASDLKRGEGVRGGEEARAEEVGVERKRGVRPPGAGERPDERVMELHAAPKQTRRDQCRLDPRDQPRVPAAAAPRQQLHVASHDGNLVKREDWAGRRRSLAIRRNAYEECCVVERHGGYLRAGDGREALVVFSRMQAEGVCPDDTVLVGVLAACAQLGALEHGKWVHGYLKANCIRITVFLGTALVDMYAKCGEVQLGMEVFEGVKDNNVLTWTTMIKGLAMHGQGSDTLRLLSRMESLCVEPDDVAFIGELCACTHTGLVEKGRKLFNSMVNKKANLRNFYSRRCHWMVFDITVVKPSEFVEYGLGCLEQLADSRDHSARLVRHNLRVMVAGGDGTVGWVLGCLGELYVQNREPVPPVAVISLGTGNDLSRSFGWGASFPFSWKAAAKRSLYKAILGTVSSLDSWHVVVSMPEGEEEKELDLPHSLRHLGECTFYDDGTAEGELSETVSCFDGVFYNYFSIGMDAQVAYGFHQLRDEKPFLASGPLSNKLIYAGYTCKQGWFFTQCISDPELRGLTNIIRLSIKKMDSSEWEHIPVPSSVRAIVALNLHNYASGKNPWGNLKPGYLEKERICRSPVR